MVTLIAAEMLWPTRCWPRPRDRDALQGVGGKDLIVGVRRPRDGDSRRNATPSVSPDRLTPDLPAISRVFPGFFPRQAAVWSSLHPTICQRQEIPFDQLVAFSSQARLSKSRRNTPRVVHPWK